MWKGEFGVHRILNSVANSYLSYVDFRESLTVAFSSETRPELKNQPYILLVFWRGLTLRSDWAFVSGRSDGNGSKQEEG